MSGAVLAEARRLHAARIGTLPIRHDGSKAPALDTWSHLKTRLPSAEELGQHYRNGNGLAVIAGRVSGNVEDIDIDEPALHEPWCALVESQAPGLLKRLPEIQTPSGGYAISYRHEGQPAGSAKLAVSEDHQTLIETRGEGGYFIVPPSPAACHPLKLPYRLLQGDLAALPVLTTDERALLLDAARTFNRMPARVKREPRPASNAHGTRPGDDFNKRANWRDILEPHGWTQVYERDGVGCWRRPGKDAGISATTDYMGSGVLYVFSTNAAPFDADTSFSKFGAYTALEHDGDYSKAARGLRLAGFGTSYSLTDTGNGRRLVEQHGRDLLYVMSQRKWHIFDGQRWAVDDTGEVTRRAKDTVASMYEEAKYAGEQREAVGRWALRSESVRNIDAMIKSASTDEEVRARVQQFDRDQMVLNVANGTIDLNTAKLRPHNRADLTTKLSPVRYDRDAHCPTWLHFLARIFDGDADLISYVQRAVGYSLTASIAEQCLFVLHGGGANGKTTFIETLAALMGDYAVNAPADTLMLRPAGAPSNDLARLRGARLVTAAETDAGGKLAEARIKSLTGGDTITARFLYAEHFDFKLDAKIWLSTNHRPAISGTDHAIWRRIRLIPFDVTIPPDQQDKILPAKLRAELPGILAWAVEGCLRWQREGLTVPAAVEAVTTAYRADQDPLAGWLAACCVVAPDAEATTAALYASYEMWSHLNDEEVMSKKSMAACFTERGFTKKQTKTARMWRGVALKR